MKTIKQITFATITVVVTLVILDLVLHLVANLSSSVNEATSILSAKIPDQKLGHRPNPAYPDHDEKGFRNPKVPETTDIVALGDSQTYGSGVRAEQSWPRVLESISALSVYNMGLGGYGPVHSFLLWDEAMELKPEIVIEAIYAGNDLHDAYSIVYNNGKANEFRTNDQDLLKAIKKLPEKTRLAITLYYYEKLTFKEIGKILNVSESRISQIHSETMTKLKKEINKMIYA